MAPTLDRKKQRKMRRTMQAMMLRTIEVIMNTMREKKDKMIVMLMRLRERGLDVLNNGSRKDKEMSEHPSPEAKSY